MKPLIVLFVLLCGVAFSGQVHAQTVYTYNDIQFDPVTPGNIMGTGYMEVSYSAQVYYNLRLEVMIYNTRTWPNNYDLQAYEYRDITYLSGTASVPYDSAGEYESKITPYVQPNFRSDDGIYFRDYYNFAVFEDGVPVLWPAAGGPFNFFGPGPQVDVSFSQIFLGTLNTLFSGGQRHGTPHHLKVVLDRYEATSCGSKRRLIRLQPVDSMGRSVGLISVEETFESTTSPPVGSRCIGNSCQNNSYCPGGCDAMRNIYFTDQLWVGCPSAGGNCGFPAVTSVWRWCPRGANFGSLVLARNVYEIKHDRALVNGRSTTYPPGAWFR